MDPFNIIFIFLFCVAVMLFALLADRERLGQMQKDLQSNTVLSLLVGIIPLALGWSLYFVYWETWALGGVHRWLVVLGGIMIVVGLFRILAMSTWRRMMPGVIAWKGLRPLLWVLWGLSVLGTGWIGYLIFF